MFKKLLILCLLASSVTYAQHVVKGTFTPAKDFEYAILYKVTPTTSLYKANAKIANDGSFEIPLDSTMTKGIYRVVYAVPQEEYNFDLIYDGKEDIELAFNAETGLKFLNSTENKLYNSYLESMTTVGGELGIIFKTDSTNKKALKKVFKTQRQTQDEFEKASKGTLAGSFIKGSRPFIPEKYKDLGTYYQAIKSNYFKHIDFSDEILQSSNFLIERMLNYIFGMTDAGSDLNTAYKANIDDVANAIINLEPSLKKTYLEIIWQQMADASYEEVANYLADSYVLPVATKLNDQELITVVNTYKNTSLNAIAPDFSFEILEDDKPVLKTLSKLDEADRYVVFFWSSVCSHCLEEIPQLREYVNTFKKGSVKVIAIGLEEEPYRWKDMTYDFPDFYHVYGEGKWDNEIGNNYNVTATPTYYVLDANKKISDKPEDIVALKKYFQEHPIKTTTEKEMDKKEKG